jgi:DMSO/TMAO reductase YedYZ molybdopterin-dependent catalytic subunit
MRPKWNILIVGLAAIVIVLVIVLFSFGGSPHGAGSLSGVEIREYDGQPLSSVNDFHLNAISGVQNVNITNYRLTVDGLTNKTMVYSYDDVIANHQNYTKVVTIHCVEGWDATILYQGVLVRDLINEAGIDPHANTVIFHATDGYTTSFPLDYFYSNDIIMAYRMNNITLPAERGYPFDLVAEEKWGYKWIKWINQIELSNNPEYQGYWEQRGYSDNGSLSLGYFSD